MLDGSGEGDVVVAELRELAQDGGAIGGAEGIGGEAGGVGVEEGAVGVFAVVGAARVVVAEREVDGRVREGAVQLQSDEGDGFGGEGGVVGRGGTGCEGVEAAVELMRHQVAGDGDEEWRGLLLLRGAKAGLQQRDGSVDAPGAAGALQLGKVGGLGGRGRRVEDCRPTGGWGGAELHELGGIVEGIEMNVGEHDDGHGARGARLRESDWLGAR